MNIARKVLYAFLLMIIFLFFLPISLYSQELIALHPFKGAAEDEELAVLFFERMEREIPIVDSRGFRTFRIDLDDLPPDVPPGGFPPWICPSPSITGDAAYAITGEASPDQDFEGNIRVRLYLWMLGGARLLGSDEMTVANPEDLELLPGLVSWALSWIIDDVYYAGDSEIIYVYSDPETIYIHSEPETVYVYSEPETVYVYSDPEHVQNPWAYEPKLIYLGIRGGGGYSNWTHDFTTNSADAEVASFASLSLAIYGTYYFANYFGVQAEAQINYDFRNNAHHGDFNVLGLTIPVTGKFVLRGDRLKAGLFVGISFFTALSETGEGLAYFGYRPDFPGFVFGIDAGWRMGPGSIILDSRFEYDFHWRNPELRIINYRSSTRFTVGYEMGFFPKK